VQKSAKLVPDAARESLIVWADSKHQEIIKSAIDELKRKLPDPQQLTSQVYRMQSADPQAALTVLASLVPTARMALDTSSRSIVASASRGDHDKIKATV